MSSTFSSLVSSAYSWGKDICSQIANGISSAASSVISKAQSLAQSVKNIIGFSLPKEGPLSDADEYMPDFMELMAKGIDGNMGDVLDKVRTVATGVRDMMADGMTIPDMSTLNLPELAFAGAGVGSTNTTTTNNNQKTTNLGGVNIYVTGGNNQDADELAKTVADKINDMLDEDNSVFK